jgi:hypothetical protein
VTPTGFHAVNGTRAGCAGVGGLDTGGGPCGVVRGSRAAAISALTVADDLALGRLQSLPVTGIDLRRSL